MGLGWIKVKGLLRAPSVPIMLIVSSMISIVIMTIMFIVLIPAAMFSSQGTFLSINHYRAPVCLGRRRTAPLGLCALANSFQHGLIVLIVLELQGLYNSLSLNCLIIVKNVQLIVTSMALE